MSSQESNTHAVLGQKYAYATASLVLGILCFVNFAGMEKATVAIIFAWLALKSTPRLDSSSVGGGQNGHALAL